MQTLNQEDAGAITMNGDVLVKETNRNEIAVESNPVQILSIIGNLVQRENFDINALEKLMVMQNNAEDRQAKKAFNVDFSAMMGEIPVIAKTGTNSHNGQKFAKLEDIVEIVRPILDKYGFSVTYKQDQQMLEGVKFEPKNVFCMMTVTCVLKHRLGHEESNSMLLPIAMIQGQTPIQAMGMGSTYGRRYTLMQALNIATAGQDNDGSIADFVQVAKSAKKTLKDDQLAKALQKSKLGTVDFMRDLIDRFELTEEQKDFVNGQLFTQEETENSAESKQGE